MIISPWPMNEPAAVGTAREQLCAKVAPQAIERKQRDVEREDSRRRGRTSLAQPTPSRSR